MITETPKKETFTRQQVIDIMENLRIYNYDWEKHKWSMGGHMAPSMIKDTTDELLSRFEYSLKDTNTNQ